MHLKCLLQTLQSLLKFRFVFLIMFGFKGDIQLRLTKSLIISTKHLQLQQVAYEFMWTKIQKHLHMYIYTPHITHMDCALFYTPVFTAWCDLLPILLYFNFYKVDCCVSVSQFNPVPVIGHLFCFQSVLLKGCCDSPCMYISAHMWNNLSQNLFLEIDLLDEKFHPFKNV